MRERERKGEGEKRNEMNRRSASPQPHACRLPCRVMGILATEIFTDAEMSRGLVHLIWHQKSMDQNKRVHSFVSDLFKRQGRLKCIFHYGWWRSTQCYKLYAAHRPECHQRLWLQPVMNSYMQHVWKDTQTHNCAFIYVKRKCSLAYLTSHEYVNVLSHNKQHLFPLEKYNLAVNPGLSNYSYANT